MYWSPYLLIHRSTPIHADPPIQRSPYILMHRISQLQTWFVFKPKYWAICLNIFFVLFFCLLPDLLAVRINCRFTFFYKYGMTWKVRSLCLTTMVLVNKAPGEDAKISYVPKGHSAFSVWICNHMRLNLLKKIAYTFMSSFINSDHSNSKLIVFTVLHPNVRKASIVCVCVCLRWSAYVSVPDLFCLKEWTFLQLLRTQQCVNSGLPACRRILFPLLHEGKGKSSLFRVQQRK